MTRKNHKHPLPTGNPWEVSKDNPPTVPVPLPVIIVKVEGPYTERDRKLWTFLLHAVWEELGKTPIHELPVTKVNQVFRDCGGEHDSNWIWDSARRLTRTIVEWLRIEGDTRYKGISSLFGAEVSDEAKKEGLLRFAFPALLIPILKEPGRFARLRVHFLIGLSGKYAVTLYELLESVANKQEPVLDVPIDTLREWLKVPEGKLSTWDNFNRRALLPAIEQINASPLGAGFTVAMQLVKKGKVVDRVRFHVKKVNERQVIEKALQGSTPPTKAVMCKGSQPLPGLLSSSPHLSTSDYEKAKAAAPGLDVYYLEREWREWTADKPKPENPSAAFIAFCRRKYQRDGSSR
jgi:hypothetical protein